MSIQQIVGIGFLMLGMISMSSYSEKFPGLRLEFFYKELEPMQERWGKTTGTILHVLAYVVAPIGFGLIFLVGLVVFH
jgi:uncharacterized membrane protein YkvA (DUF1232 family)